MLLALKFFPHIINFIILVSLSVIDFLFCLISQHTNRELSLENWSIKLQSKFLLVIWPSIFFKVQNMFKYANRNEYKVIFKNFSKPTFLQIFNIVQRSTFKGIIRTLPVAVSDNVAFYKNELILVRLFRVLYRLFSSHQNVCGLG